MSSILDDTKKVLGVGADDTSFDIDILMHLNTVFSTLSQMGVGPAGGLMIEDNTADWDALTAGDARYNMVKSYVYLRIRQIFDPPSTSFLITSFKEQQSELEWRISSQREYDLQLAAASVEVAVE